MKIESTIRKITIVGIGMLILVAAATQVTKIYVSNSNALGSVEATRLRAEIDLMQDRNMAIEADVLIYSSYTNVASRAAELGFAQNRDIVSVYDPQPVTIAR